MKAIKENIKRVLLEIKNYCVEIVAKPSFFVPFIFCIVVSYSFTLFNRTIFIDDLAQQIYYGQARHKIRSLRWGQAITGYMFSTERHTPFLNKFIGLIFFVLAVILLGTILYHLDKKRDNAWKYTLFSCFFISYPLVTEFYGYFEALIIPSQFLLISFAVLYQILRTEKTVYDYLTVGIILSIVVSGYESVAFAYISLVLLVLYIEYVINIKNDERIIAWIKEGFTYAVPLAIALIMKYVVGCLFVFITDHMNMIDNGGRAIYWGSVSISEIFTHIMMNGYLYFIRGLSFLPITEFAVALIVFIVFAFIKQKDRKNSILLSFLFFISLFTLSFLQGDILPYRTAQSVQLFVAYVVYLLCDEIQKKKIGKILIVVLLFVCLRQSIYTHQLFALDNQRSNNETALVQSIGRELYTEYDLSKPVIFCGKYHLGNNITNQVTIKQGSLEDYIIKNYIGENNRRINRRLTDRNVSSVINWSLRAFGNQDMMKEYLSYCGYDINVSEESFNQETNDKYERIALENNMRAHSIKDMGNYILVYFGKID